MSIIIIAVFASACNLLSLSVGKEIIQVILYHSRRRCEITLRELVDIEIVVSSEKIVQLLVVFSTVPFEIGSSCQCEQIVCGPFDISRNIHIILVDTTLLNRIFGPA